MNEAECLMKNYGDRGGDTTGKRERILLAKCRVFEN